METPAQQRQHGEPPAPQRNAAPEGGEAPAQNDAPSAEIGEAELAELETPAPCEDERWGAFVNGIKAARPHLAAQLRRAEVRSIGEDAVEFLAPAGTEMGAQELEFLQPLLREAFGASFHLHLNRDTNEKARHANSMVGRLELRQEAGRRTQRQEAEADETVQRILRFFPESKIEHIESSRREPNGSKDV